MSNKGAIVIQNAHGLDGVLVRRCGEIQNYRIEVYQVNEGAKSVSDLLVESEVLDVEGAASLLLVGKSTIYELAGKRNIPHQKVGRYLRFSRSALLAWLGGATPHGERNG